MYLAVLHKTPTQLVDSSKVFKRQTLQKQPRIINNWQKDGKKSQPNTWTKSVPRRTKFFLKMTTIFSPDSYCQKRHFTWSNFVFLISHLSWTLTLISPLRTAANSLNHFIRFHFLDTDKTFQNTKHTTSNASLRNYQTISPCILRSEV